MPKMIVGADRSDSDAGRFTLSERVVATQLHDDRYATPLIERIAWAALDAEQLESPTDREQADEHRGLRPTRATVPSHSVSSRRARLVAGHASRRDMTTERPISTRPAPDRRRRRSARGTTGQARSERDHEQADALWLRVVL